MLHTKQKSRLEFSLMELLVVTAIVGLLAAIALPSFKSYTSRSKIIEIFSLALAWTCTFANSTS
jgi:type IV pilus assembly protein PilA